ncbi:MAG: hypothetical protein ACI8ZN_001548, partial [Bacteroidia bacterium]
RRKQICNNSGCEHALSSSLSCLTEAAFILQIKDRKHDWRTWLLRSPLKYFSLVLLNYLNESLATMKKSIKFAPLNSHVLKCVCALLIIFAFMPASKAQPFLHTPIAGVEGEDYVIVNYVDWSEDTAHDIHCGSKTYDGHEGTDFVIRSFPQMDSGVAVLAAAAGKVTFVKDGLFDRETISVVSKGLGNYIAIEHPNKFYSYYGHLAKNSVSVKIGDAVKVGDTIGFVGSSGNSTDPHLHFEIWYDSLKVVDPFKGGACSTNPSLWIKEPVYDTSFRVWESGMMVGPTTLDSLRERTSRDFTKPYEYVGETETNSMVFWAHLLGYKKGDIIELNIVNANSNQSVYTHIHTVQRDWWYYYFWVDLGKVNIFKNGKYRVELFHKNKYVIDHEFSVVGVANVDEKKKSANQECLFFLKSNTLHLLAMAAHNENIHVFDGVGKSVDVSNALEGGTINLPSGVYMFQLMAQGSQRCIVKRFVH